ncbi:MAG TPA: MBL fold metallo-hydrolase [Pyrinomonadaceae bacterium]|nr:MBL fold metallo-hydrolase [Pyrinomonadaceae bacterium]
MNRASSVAVALVLGLCVVTAPALAQRRAARAGAAKGGTLSERSYARARQILDAALAAHGGLEAIRAAGDVSVKISGHGLARNQSVDIGTPYDRQRHDESLYVDLANRRYIFESRDELPGGFVFGGKNVVSGGQGFFVNPRDRTVTPINMANFNNVGIVRRVPHVFLLALHETAAATLRYLGEDTFDGRRHHVVTAASTNGIHWALYFDAATNLLSKYEIVVSDNLAGDAVQEWVFPAYRTVAGLKVPTRRVTRRAGEVTEEVTYDDVRFGAKLPEAAFAKPDGHEELPTPQPPPTRETKLADGVYLFESGVNSLVVEFDTYVLVVEPPSGGRGPKPTITKVKEMFPGKPVRYVVVTHFHDDHSGGVRSYVAEGAAIVTTPANRQYFERMAAATFTVAPDDQTRARKKPVFEFVRGGKRVFTDGKQTVEVIDIGPGPHAREMLVAYLPKEKLVFQGDLVNLPNSGKWMPSTVNDTTVHFLEALSRLNLDVKRVAAVHGPATSIEDLREAVGRKRASR